MSDNDNTQIERFESETRTSHRKSRAGLVAVISAAMASLIIGIGIGFVASPEVKGEAPTACLGALELADEALGYAADYSFADADAWEAQGNNDLVGMERALNDMDAALAGLEDITEDYVALKERCRNGE